MQLLPMASSPDGLISARYALITKPPGWEVLTTTRGEGEGGGWRPLPLWGVLGRRNSTGIRHPHTTSASRAYRSRLPDPAVVAVLLWDVERGGVPQALRRRRLLPLTGERRLRWRLRTR